MLKERGVKIWHATVAPAELLYTPPGFWVIEVPINGENNFGIRTSIVPHLVEDSQSYLGFVAIAGLAGHDAVSKSYYEIVKKVLLPHKLASVPPDPKEQPPIATA